MIQIRHRFALLATVALLGSTGLVSAAEPRGAVMGATGGAAVTSTPTTNAATPGSPALNAANPSATGPAGGTPTGAGAGSTVSGNPPPGPQGSTVNQIGVTGSGLPSCTTNPSTSISAANSGQAMSDTSTGANLNSSATTGSGSSASPGC